MTNNELKGAKTTLDTMTDEMLISTYKEGVRMNWNGKIHTPHHKELLKMYEAEIERRGLTLGE